MRRQLLLPAAAVAALPLFFVLHGLSQWGAFIPGSKAAILLLGYEVAAFALFGLMSWRIGATRSALLTVALLSFYFFFGAFRDGLLGALHSGLFTRYSAQLPAWIVLWTLISIALMRMKKQAAALRFVVLLLVVWILVDIPAFVRQSGSNKTLAEPPAAVAERPDVYLILLDEYAGAEQLRQDFGFDNRPFLDSLRTLGFSVRDSSCSNYRDTPFSMASLFSCSYLHLPDLEYSNRNLNQCYATVYRGAGVERFRNAGYELRNFSIFDFEDAPSPCENTLLVSGAGLISSQTLGQRLWRDLYRNLVRTRFPESGANRRLTYECDRINRQVEDLLLSEARRKSARPRFVYAHLLLPHFPYYYNADGTPYPLRDLAPAAMSRKDLYVGYLQYANRRVLDLVRAVRRSAARPPVILLLSDHGFRYAGDPQMAYSNLAALHLPGDTLPPAATNVNQLRVLANRVLGDTLSLLPDRFY